MVRVVLDTVVFVRALIRSRSICGRLAFEFHTKYQPVTSPDILREILEVLNRPEIRAKSQHYNRISLELILSVISSAEVVEPKEQINACRDPHDNKFIEAAIAGNAQYVVSEDKDLLDMGEYQGIRMIDCRSFIELLEANH